MADDEPKIFVDEDWKARVQREKTEAKSQQNDAGPQSPKDGNEEAAGPEPPPFVALISSLASQAMFALGVIAPRDAKQIVVNLDEAKFTIDLLMMLREKTKGNLTPEEDGMLTTTIAELQQVYVVRVQQVHESAMQQAGVDPNQLRA